jgi:hypothetical protein
VCKVKRLFIRSYSYISFIIRNLNLKFKGRGLQKMNLKFVFVSQFYEGFIGYIASNEMMVMIYMRRKKA